MSVTTRQSETATPAAGWVLYDGSCGVCRTWVPRWQRSLERAGFEVAPLQADWVAERTGLSLDELVEDFRVLRSDGQLVSGANAYRDIMRHFVWLRPLVWLIERWPMRGLFDACYRRIAANRHRISRTCRLN